MRTKLIITGAIGVLAAATLTVNAQTNTQKANPGSVARLLAAGAQIARTDHDDVTIAAHVAATAAAQSEKPEVAESEKAEPVRPTTPKLTLSASCQAALATFKAARVAEATEDAKERSTATGEDRTEDAAEAQQLMAALAPVKDACMPAVPTTCRMALAGLLPLLQSLRNDEWSESRTGTDSFADGATLRAGFASVAATCVPSE